MLLEGSQIQRCSKGYQPAHDAGMNATLQQEDNIRQSLDQTQDALERSQDRYRTYADLQHQLKMLSSQVPPKDQSVSYPHLRGHIPHVTETLLAVANKQALMRPQDAS